MSSEIRTPLPKRENNRTQPYITKLRGMLDKVKAGAPAHDDGIRFFKTLDTVDTFETSPPPMVKIYARSLQFVMIMRPPPHMVSMLIAIISVLSIRLSFL